MPPVDNTRFLRDAEQRRRDLLTKQASSAIDKLRQGGGEITFAAVVRESGVSRAFLYRQPDLVAAVQAARQEPHSAAPPPPTRERMSDTSKEARIRQLAASNAELRAEVDLLRAQNAALLGELRSLRSHQGPHPVPLVNSVTLERGPMATK